MLLISGLMWITYGIYQPPVGQMLDCVHRSLNMRVICLKQIKWCCTTFVAKEKLKQKTFLCYSVNSVFSSCAFPFMVSCFIPSSTPRLSWMSAWSVSMCGLGWLRQCIGPLWRTKPVSHGLWWGELSSRRGLSGVWLDLSKPHLCPQRAALQRTQWLCGQLWWRGLWWERWAGSMLCPQEIEYSLWCWLHDDVLVIKLVNLVYQCNDYFNLWAQYENATLYICKSGFVWSNCWQ